MRGFNGTRTTHGWRAGGPAGWTRRPSRGARKKSRRRRRRPGAWRQMIPPLSRTALTVPLAASGADCESNRKNSRRRSQSPATGTRCGHSGRWWTDGAAPGRRLARDGAPLALYAVPLTCAMTLGRSGLRLRPARPGRGAEEPNRVSGSRGEESRRVLIMQKSHVATWRGSTPSAVHFYARARQCSKGGRHFTNGIAGDSIGDATRRPATSPRGPSERGAHRTTRTHGIKRRQTSETRTTLTPPAKEKLISILPRLPAAPVTSRHLPSEPVERKGALSEMFALSNTSNKRTLIER